MKKGTLLAISLVVIGICVSCAPMPANVRTQNVQTFKRTASHQDIVTLNQILNNAKRRGYLSEEDLEYGLGRIGYGKNSYDVDSSYVNETAKFYVDAIYWELLPYKATFDRSLEKGEYSRAEDVRIEWILCLNKFSSLRPDGYLPESTRQQVEKVVC